MPNNPRLFFTIGPVQPFVEASRRTRDLWASSFLLSHLATAAISGAERTGAKIILPHRDVSDAQRKSDNDQAGVPNRFVAEGNDLEAAAKAAEAKFYDAWYEIANAVHEKFIAPIASHGNGTEAIWNRQIANFWDSNWVIGGPNALALRKNWRTLPVTVEPGDHCTMMGDWQELSGFVRSRKPHEQNSFWKKVRDGVGKLDLADDERLCAIALIKRLAPKVAEKWLGKKLDETNWPSTPYHAAVPWLRNVSIKAAANAKEFAKFARSLGPDFESERTTNIRSLEAVKQNDPEVKRFLSLDGNLFQENALRNERVVPLDEGQRNQLRINLDKLCEIAGANPSVFYSLLLMDGDSMGELLSEARRLGANEEENVTAALGCFAATARDIVRNHDGVTVYAGGDDLLAMLPVTTAIGCAIEVQAAYINSFANTCSRDIENKASISAAIVNAHYRYPLRNLLEHAHFLLDDIAKEATGRASMATSVFKMSGENCRWSAPWRHFKTENGNLLDEVIEGLGTEDTGDHDRREFTSSFFFNIRERFSRLTETNLHEPGTFGQLAVGVNLEELLLAEYLRGFARSTTQGEDEDPRERAHASIKKLLKFCQRTERSKDSGDPDTDEHTLGIDGLLLVRFLASERMRDDG